MFLLLYGCIFSKYTLFSWIWRVIFILRRVICPNFGPNFEEKRFFLKIFAEKFGTSKKVLTFATRLRNNGSSLKY